MTIASALEANQTPIDWVILTTGARMAEIDRAVLSVLKYGDPHQIIVVGNGCKEPTRVIDPKVKSVISERNLGAPGGRNLGVRNSEAAIVGFLDDDAELLQYCAERLRTAFTQSQDLGVVAFRIVDDSGSTLQRHNPHIGRSKIHKAGQVATFLEGACAIRRDAFVDVGGYFEELQYSHEQLDFSWRLHEAGYKITYDPLITIYHPPTEISRHAKGWWQSGHNRVVVARRNLPWAIAVTHALIWLTVGLLRAGECRLAYARGWCRGWRTPTSRRPISWRTVRKLARAGRPPLI